MKKVLFSFFALCAMTLSSKANIMVADTLPDDSLTCLDCDSSDVRNRGLVACYPFNGNANDESGHGRNATVNGATLIRDRYGKANSAYRFDGNDYMTIANPNDFKLTQYTYSAWFRVTNNANSKTVLGIGGYDADQAIQIAKATSNNDQLSGISYYGSGPYSGTNATVSRNLNGPWHHVAVTKSSNGLIVYLDGARLAMNSSATNNPAYKHNGADPNLIRAIIGARIATLNTLVNYFEGDLDDIRIYNRALDSLGVDSLYRSDDYCYCFSCTDSLDYRNYGLVACYPFDGDANDVTGSGHNGTVSGATLTTDRFGNSNSAYLFDGINDYIALANPTGFANTEYTYSLWMKPGNTSASKSPVCIGGYNADQALQIEFNSVNNGRLNGVSYYGSGGSYSANSTTEDFTFSSSQWYHIALTKSSLGMNLYINGQLVENNSAATQNAAYSHNSGSILAILGARIASGSNLTYYFNGSIDEVKIFSAAIPGNFIKLLYNHLDSCDTDTSAPFPMMNRVDETDARLAGDIKIYPNPSEKIFNIDLSALNTSGEKKMIVSNLLGQTVYETSSHDNMLQLNLEAAPNGLYLVNIYNDKGELLSTGKLIKNQ